MKIAIEPAKRAAADYLTRCRPFHGLTRIIYSRSWGLRPRLYSATCSAGSTPYIIIGVLPHNFHFALVENAEFWTTLNPDNICHKLRSCHNLNGVARLKDSVAIDTALADLTRIAKDLEIQYPDSNRHQGRAFGLGDLAGDL